MKYDFQSFIAILRKHYNLQKFKVIKGLSSRSIKRVIEEYFDLHGTSISEEMFQKTSKKDEEFIEKIKQLKSDKNRQKMNK